MDDLELNVGLGETPIIDAGARVPLWIRAHNHGAALARELRIEVTAAASLLLVSNNVWLRSQPAGEKLAFALPALSHDECCELTVDAYAVRAGEARCAVRLDVDGDMRDMEVAGEVRAWPAFAESANRFEFPVREAEAGAGVDGFAIVTNTGFGHALVSKITIDGDLDCTVDAEPFELAPGERRVLAVAARVPAAAADGTVLRARATCALASGEAIVLGDATVRARSRPRIEGRIDCTSERDVDAGDRVGWALHVENTGGAIADAVSIALRLAGGSYATGSTTIDDARVIDVGGTSPLWSHEGLCIEQLAPGVGLTLAFAAVAEPNEGAMKAWAQIACADNELLLESPPVTVRDWGTCAALRFTARGVLVRGPVQATQSPVSRMRRSQHAALEPAMANYLAGLNGLMRHLWALAVLCADRCDDPEVQLRIGSLRIALRSVFDRLAIKLRMPHYPVRIDDVLDPAAADALYAANVAVAGTLGARLARAAQLVAPEGDDYPELAAYRDALQTRLCAYADDAALIDALVASQPALDVQLDAVLTHEIGART